MFYKIVQDGKIIDVLAEISYVKIQIASNRLIRCGQEYSEGILSSDGSQIYYCEDLIRKNSNDYSEVTITEIDEEEYEALREALELDTENNGIEDTVEEEDEEETEEIAELSEEELLTIETVKSAKIAKMSKACNTAIVNGFDVTLSDENTYHFDYDLEEQINIMYLKDLINSGAESVPYHASGEACRFFSVEDFTLIADTGVSHRTYHTTYYNSLKQYINSLTDITEISEIEYGVEIPKEYCSEIMVSLISELEESEDE